MDEAGNRWLWRAGCHQPAGAQRKRAAMGVDVLGAAGAVSSANSKPSMSGNCKSRIATSNGGLCMTNRKPHHGRGRLVRTTGPHCSARCLMMRRFVGLSSTTSNRRPESCGLRALPRRGRRRGGSACQYCKSEMSLLASVALDPNFPSHQFGKTFANRQAQSSASIMTRRRSIDLLKGFEQPVSVDPGGCRMPVSRTEK